MAKVTHWGRKRIFELLEPRATAKTSDQFVDRFLMLLIVLNVAAVCLESVSTISEKYAQEFQVFELVSVFIFTVEYLLRIWTAMEFPKFEKRGVILGRIRFMLSPIVLTDIIVILPFYLSYLGLGLDLRFLRVLRLRRAFRLTRYSKGIQLLFEVLQQEKRFLGAIAFFTFLTLIAASSGLYIAENKAQPGVFSSIPATMWWAVNTLTTVGQSGIIPVTSIGQIIAGLMALIGVVIVGLMAGVMAAGFSGAANLHRNRYQYTLETHLRQGQNWEEARNELEPLTLELGLRPNVVEAIENEVRHRQEAFDKICPHCGKLID